MDAHRPSCPRHPTSTVRLDGYFGTWNDKHRRPRYRCIVNGRRLHAFAPPRPVRQPSPSHPHSGQACWTCEHEFERHEGHRTGRHFLFALAEMADLLDHVSNGGSQRRSSKKRREDIHRTVRRQWRHIGPGQTSQEGHLASGYIDAYAPIVIDALAPKEWPKVIAIDSMPLRTRGYRDGVKVGDLNAGEIMVAIDHTGQKGKPCLIQVQGGKDSYSWRDFFSTLAGEPEWVVADLDRGIAKAVREVWPNAILFRSRDHLKRLMEDYAVLDGVERTVRITDPIKLQKPKRAMWPWNQQIQEFEPHPLFNQMTYCQGSLAEWDLFKAMVDEHVPPDRTELRSWIATNDPLIQVQCLLAEDNRSRLVSTGRDRPVGSGNVEGTIREHLATYIKPRAGRYQNARRLNKILALMMLSIRGNASKGVILSVLRQHFTATAHSSNVADWHAWEDHGGRSSLAQLVHDAEMRQLHEEKVAKRRTSAAIKYRRYQEEEARRSAAGQKPLHRGTRRRRAEPRRRRSVRGKCVADLSDLMRDWDYSLNWGSDPTTLRATSTSRVFWQCHHDEDHVWAARITDRAAHLSRCPFCMGNRVHPKDSLAADSPHLAREWHPERNGQLRPHEVTPGSGRKVWWRCEAAGHEWQAYVFARAKQLNNCKECHDQAKRRKTKKPGRTKGTGSPKRKKETPPPTAPVPADLVPAGEDF